jgi:hypothetical protein
MDMGLLDDGSEIVVVRKDLWEKLGHGANVEKRVLMQEANGSTQMMDVFRIGGWWHEDLGTCVRGPFAPYKITLRVVLIHPDRLGGIRSENKREPNVRRVTERNKKKVFYCILEQKHI